MKASGVKVGDRTVLDMGKPGGHSLDEVCTVVSVKPGFSLLKDLVIKMRVKRYDSQLISVIDHEPHHEVDLAAELIGNTSVGQIEPGEAPK